MLRVVVTSFVLRVHCAADCIWSPGAPPRFFHDRLNRSQFDSLVRDGVAFVVDGTAKASGLWSWSCESIREDPVFRGAAAQLSYGKGDGYVGLSSAWEANVSSTGAAQRDNEAPKKGSLYFGIKDIQFTDANAPRSWRPAMLKRVQDLTALPPYMDSQNLWRDNPDGISELDSLHSSPELWLSTEGAGAQAHMDQHVSSTVSLQLAGRKRWRLSQVPDRQTVTSNSEYADGNVYRRKKRWMPHYDIVLEAGDALFFPPGTIHETTNTDAACALSITHQFSVPMPVRYYRSLVQRFRRSGDMQESWPLLQKWTSLLGHGKEAFQDAEVPGQLTKEAFLQYANHDSHSALEYRDAFAFIDVDQDGVITLAELASASEDLRAAARPKPKVPPRVSDEL